ncbi:hypothetical protein AK812_SmicGene47440, partial [Symbiodinium microadriaticum]
LAPGCSIPLEGSSKASRLICPVPALRKIVHDQGIPTPRGHRESPGLASAS